MTRSTSWTRPPICLTMFLWQSRVAFDPPSLLLFACGWGFLLSAIADLLPHFVSTVPQTCPLSYGDLVCPFSRAVSWLDPSTRQACVEWARNAGKLLEDVLTKTLCLYRDPIHSCRRFFFFFLGCCQLIAFSMFHVTDVNFVGEAVSEDVKEASFGQDKLERLRAIKRKYDPENRFCHNHNIAP